METFFRNKSVEQAAEENYNFFIQELLNYQKMFNNGGDLYSILQLPYPLFRDVIRAQFDREKKTNNQPSNQITVPFNQSTPDPNTWQ